MPAKIVTYSMDELTIRKLAQLQDWLHDTNKSRILCTLIDKEHLRQQALRHEEEL